MPGVTGFTCHACNASSTFTTPEITLLSEATDLSNKHARKYKCTNCGAVNVVDRTSDEWKVIDGRRI